MDAARKANSTRTGKRSTRAASSTRSSGWRKSACCTSSSTPTSSRSLSAPTSSSAASRKSPPSWRRASASSARTWASSPSWAWASSTQTYDRRHYRYSRPRWCSRRRRRPCLAPRGCSRPVAAPPSSLARRHAAAAPLRRLPPRMIGALPLHDDPELVLLLSLCRPTTSAPLSYPPPLLPPSSPPPSFHRSHRRPLSPRCSRRRDRRRHRRRRRRRAHQGHPVLHVEAGHFDQIMMSSPLLTRWRPLCVCQSVTLEFNVVTNVFMQHNSICSRPRPC